MIYRFLPVCAAVCLFITVTVLGEDQDDWEEVRNVEGIRIYTREIPESPLIAVRGISLLDAGLFKTGHIIRDISRYPEWVPQLQFARIVEQEKKSEWLVYLLIELPWPVSDRDVLLSYRTEINETGDRITYHIHSVEHDSVPELPDVIRAEIPAAMIMLAGNGQEQTLLDANMQLDLKGFIPFFVNHFITRKLPVKLISRLRRQSRKDDIVVDTIYWNDLVNQSSQSHR